jgi:hypothetical protein
MASARRRRLLIPSVISLLLPLLYVFALVAAQAAEADASVDFEYPHLNISEISFGSCHNAKHNRNGKVFQHVFENVENNNNSISPNNEKETKNVWIWTGDAVYPPQRNIASVDLLRKEYYNFRHNNSLGYAKHIVRNNQTIMLGTWDDHE